MCYAMRHIACVGHTNLVTLNTVVPAKAGTQFLRIVDRIDCGWELGRDNASGIVPACAGMTLVKGEGSCFYRFLM